MPKQPLSIIVQTWYRKEDVTAGRIKLVSGVLALPVVAAVGFHLVPRLVEKIFYRLVELVIEETITVVPWLVELVVSRLDGFVTDSVLP